MDLDFIIDYHLDASWLASQNFKIQSTDRYP